jgi:hypothetical protein
LEICALQLETKSANLIILSLYRTPLGDINEFLKRLGIKLKSLYSLESEFIICGDININYLNENNHKQQINSLLTRVQNSSSTAIGNIFIDSVCVRLCGLVAGVSGCRHRSGFDSQRYQIF